MNNKTIKKSGILVIGILFLVILVGFGVYKYSKEKTYNNLITTANKYMDSSEYDKAITLFNQSLKYKKDSNIKNNIKLAEHLKNMKKLFEEGINFEKGKKYLEAIEKFNKISKEDKNLYNKSQKSIDECKQSFIKQNIDLANSSIKNNEIDKVDTYLNNISKIDPNNAELKKLKNDLSSIKEKEEAKKVQASKEISSKKNITKSQAENMVLNNIKNKLSNTIVIKEDTEVTDDFNIHAYKVHIADNMGDHVATRGWFFVDINTGTIYQWDIATNSINPV